MTITMEVLGWFMVAAGLPLYYRGGGMYVGAAGAILLGMAYAKAFH